MNEYEVANIKAFLKHSAGLIDETVKRNGFPPLEYVHKTTGLTIRLVIERHEETTCNSGLG